MLCSVSLLKYILLRLNTSGKQKLSEIVSLILYLCPRTLRCVEMEEIMKKILIILMTVSLVFAISGKPEKINAKHIESQLNTYHIETQVNFQRVDLTFDDTMVENELAVRIDTEYQPEAIVSFIVAVLVNAKIIGYVYVYPLAIYWAANPGTVPLSVYIESAIKAISSTVNGVTRIFLSNNQSSVTSIQNEDNCIWIGPLVGGHWICPRSI